MGDRANIVIVPGWEPRLPVYLYTHWGGEGLPEKVSLALSPQQRWDDASYLARIVFDVLKGGDAEGFTGFGISAVLTDNEHHLLVLDCGTREVVVLREADHDIGNPGGIGLDMVVALGRVPFAEAAGPGGGEAIRAAGWA